MQEDISKNTEHEIIINKREKMNVSGVMDVISFDEKSVMLETLLGDMIIQGEDIRISTLNLERGMLSLSGRVDGLYYNTSGEKGSRGLFGRLRNK